MQFGSESLDVLEIVDDNFDRIINILNLRDSDWNRAFKTTKRELAWKVHIFQCFESWVDFELEHCLILVQYFIYVRVSDLQIDAIIFAVVKL